MGTHVPGFQSFCRFFLHNFVSAASSISVKLCGYRSCVIKIMTQLNRIKGYYSYMYLLLYYRAITKSQDD